MLAPKLFQHVVFGPVDDEVMFILYCFITDNTDDVKMLTTSCDIH